MSTIEQTKAISPVEAMKAKLEEATKSNADKVAEAIELRQMSAKLAVLTDDKLVAIKANASIKADTTAKLNNIEAQCKAIVEAMPVYSAKTKENRKWNPSRQYGLGNQIAILTGILSGIQYSATEHREQMLALTGLNADIIEDTLESFGSPAYFSKNYDMVIDAIPADVQAIKDNLTIIATMLDITDLDTSKINIAHIATRFATAKARADMDKLAMDKTKAKVAQVESTLTI